MKRKTKKKNIIYKPKTKFVVNKELDRYENIDLAPHKTAWAEEFFSRVKFPLPE